MTLDQIENTVLAEFDDPRVYLALGRGAVGSGRLRSEAFSAKAVDKQLDETKAQFAVTPRWSKIDALAGKVSISPILSWRVGRIHRGIRGRFVRPAEARADRARGDRIPAAALLAAEEEFIRKNTFQLAYEPFDWRLNDLTGGGLTRAREWLRVDLTMDLS